MAKKRKLGIQRTDISDGAVMNSATYADYNYRLKKIATSIFEWINLPDSMDARYIEKCLYYQGTVALLKSDKYGFINTKATDNGQFNIYGLPTELHCYSYSFNENRRLYSGLNEANPASETEECILVMNTWDRLPTDATIQLFAYRLAEAERTIDGNVKAQKTPILILTDENQRLTLRNTYLQYDSNAPVITGDKNQLTADSIRVLKTDAPYVVDKLSEYKKDIWNECLSFLGVNNIAYEKRERLVADETNSNNELINLNLMSFLEPRKLACKQFNEKFGLTGDQAIDVKVRSDLDNIIKRTASVVVDEYADKVIEKETFKDMGVVNE